MLTEFMFLIPLIVALGLGFGILWQKGKKFKIKSIRRIGSKGIIDRLVFGVDRYLIPSKDSKIYGYYNGLLAYTKLTVGEFFTIKYGVSGATALLILLIHLTNVSIYTQEIFTKYDFYKDELYYENKEGLDETKELQEEIYYLRKSLKLISKKEILQLSKEEVQGRILGIVLESQEESQLPPISIANKVYYRLYRYHQVRNLDYFFIFIAVIGLNFAPEVLLKIYNYFIRADVAQELRFLKRLIILNGSIKPVNFMEVLAILINKSKYHRKFLKEIENQNKRNTVSNSAIYRKYIDLEKDINVKLFLEKLDQANNYDFDQAIKNIENEFNIEKRQRIRNVKRQMEIINAWGIVGCFLLIGLLTLYMLIPWLQAYNMNQMF